MSETQHTENWLPIPGYEGFYSISDQGRIRADYSRRRWKAGRILSPGVHTSAGYHGSNYRHVVLCRLGAQRQWLVHRLVLLAFVGPCPSGFQANHRNGVKHDNRLENLEYVTPKGNLQHAKHVLGRRIAPITPNPLFGEAHQNSKLTTAQVLAIRERYSAGGVTQKQLAAEHGVEATCIGKIVRRVAWPHV